MYIIDMVAIIQWIQYCQKHGRPAMSPVSPAVKLDTTGPHRPNETVKKQRAAYIKATRQRGNGGIGVGGSSAMVASLEQVCLDARLL
jgi:hypothetical protein